MRFQQVSRALVARVFRFLAFLVVEIDHQSGNFSKILPLRSNVHWKSKIDSAIMAVARALRPGRGCPSEETRPEIVQCDGRSEEHTSELQSHSDLVCRLLLEKKKKKHTDPNNDHLHWVFPVYRRLSYNGPVP